LTIPHLSNCPHSGDGWCLSCVSRQARRIAELQEIKPLTQEYAAAFRMVGILIERERYEEASLWKDRYEATMDEIDSILKGTK